jgi:hypothetical protein
MESNGLTITTYVCLGLLAGSFGFFLLVLRQIRLEGRRPFGFYCDTCTGKFYKSGRPYIQCMIKPKILQMVGVDVNQTTRPREIPEWFL